ncbi:hypothetical protein [Sulfuracidifex tepidarius]|uniref:tRNA intron endonuclease catalytic domain-containing protein n=1 Tax=Sulfuracidifex tepidarius TaxID=1294262 RepID=A0A510E3X3_9CREN|nr:hypothetical protein [Sulfuracidifex tepidarius]BBG24455.1 hypothetical protein IC006_1774 [Sulfuracidifex tepidarius]BBG27213.1 hypothetical protein IC007_1752 [Sulfuracidifex tepidarius]
MSDHIENVKREEDIFQKLINRKEIRAEDISGINWDRLAVYVDLKQKGKVVCKGYDDSTLIIKDRKIEGKSKAIILVINEAEKISPTKLLDVISRSKSLNLEVLVALVDKYGDITYYNISEARLIR